MSDIHAIDTPSRAPGPLAGVGVLVTRPARQSAGLVRALAALDATAVVFPAIVIMPPAEATSMMRAHAALATYDAAIFVSSNAAEYGALPPERWPPSLAIYATGPGTASALAGVGLTQVHIPDTTYDTEGLLALPAFAHIAGKRVVIFRGEGGRDQLARVLRERGAHVDYAQCYRRTPPSGAEGLIEALREGRVQAATVTSAEGLDNLCALLPATERAMFARLPLFVPHANIAAHARAQGFAATVTGAGDAGLVAGLLEWFARHPVTRAP